MSVANSTLVSRSRNSLFTVRLAPYLVETLCELTRAVRDKTHTQNEVGGLLFGVVEDGLTTIEALKTFKDSGPRSELARRERMDKAFDAALTQAQEDLEFRDFRLIGWFSLRNGSGLMNRDIEFHNTHFKGDDDVALILWREAETQIIAELYANKLGGKMTGDDYRWSSVRLSTELRRVSDPLDLAMRLKTSDDSYAKSYAAPDAEERKDEWKKLAASAKRKFLSFLPGLGKPDEYTLGAETESQREAIKQEGPSKPSFQAKTLFGGDSTKVSLGAAALATVGEGIAAKPAREARNARDKAATQEPVEVSGLPMVINTKKKKQVAVPWLSTALIFVLFSGVTFAVLALRGLASGTGKLAQIMRVVFPGDDLGLHVESQGERLLLSWNRRNSVVSSSTGAILHIHDGVQDRNIKLDPTQVAEGAVLYRPVSGDVTFRLDVTGPDQTMATGSMRVLDATNPAANGHDGPVMDVSSQGAPPATLPAPIVPAANVPVNPAPVNAAAKPESKPVENAKTIPQSAATGSASELAPPITAVQNMVVPATQRPAVANPVTPPASILPQAPPPTPVPQTANPAANTPPANQKPVAPKVEPHTTVPATGGTAIKGWEPGESSGITQPAQTSDARTLDFVGPKVLLQVLPNTRSFAPGLVSQVTKVEVEVRIDKSGHVLSAALVNPDSVKSALGGAALSAAKQWTFQAATLKGEKVDSTHTIVFEFRPENQ